MPTLGTKTTKIDKAPTSQNNHAVEKKWIINNTRDDGAVFIT